MCGHVYVFYLSLRCLHSLLPSLQRLPAPSCCCGCCCGSCCGCDCCCSWQLPPPPRPSRHSRPWKQRLHTMVMRPHCAMPFLTRQRLRAPGRPAAQQQPVADPLAAPLTLAPPTCSLPAVVPLQGAPALDHQWWPGVNGLWPAVGAGGEGWVRAVGRPAQRLAAVRGHECTRTRNGML